MLQQNPKPKKAKGITQPLPPELPSVLFLSMFCHSFRNYSATGWQLRRLQPQLHSHRDTIVIYWSSAVTENGRFPSGTHFKGTAARHVNEKVAVGPKKNWRKGHVYVGFRHKYYKRLIYGAYRDKTSPVMINASISMLTLDTVGTKHPNKSISGTFNLTIEPKPPRRTLNIHL